MNRTRETTEQKDEERRGTPAPATPAVAPSLGSPQSVLALQRSAGNAAVSAMIARDKTAEKKSGGLGGFLRNIFGKKKKPEIKQEEIEAKTSAGEAAKKGVAVGNATTEVEKPGSGGGGKSAGAGEIKAASSEAKKAAGVIIGANRGGAKAPEAKQEEPPKAEAPPEEAKDPAEDDPLSGVGALFDAMEEAFEEAYKKDTQADEDMYAAALALAGFISSNPSGVMTAVYVILFEDVANAWLASGRRSWGLPGDKERRQKLEALLEEHKWLTDKDQVDASAVLPDPKMRAEDTTRYHVVAGTKIWYLKDDGKWGSFPLGKDFAFSELGTGALGGINGYVYESQGKKYLIETKNVRKETGGGHVKVTGKLFPPDPDVSHVKQTTLGDCYLQAAVAALANKNPGLIKAMFRDNEAAGTVTVRLYQPDHTDPKKPTFSAQYVTINKSVAQDIEGKAAYNEGSAWVRLLEKAYAAGGFTGSYGKAAPPIRDYASIASGTSDHAMEVLTGKPAREESQWGKGWHGTGSEVPWGADEHARYAEAQQPGGKYDGTLSFQILKSKEEVDKWIAFTKTKDFKDIYDNHLAKLNAGFASDLTIDDLKVGLDKFSEKGISAKILAHVEKAKLLPGKLGSAAYSQTQMETFYKVESHLLKGGMITFSSWKYPGEKKAADPSVATSAGEAVNRGMVGGHAFTVLGTRSAATQNPDDKAHGPYYWIQIRNPWGRYGRKYDFSKTAEEQGIAEPQGNGVSWVELSDVTRYFHTVRFG